MTAEHEKAGVLATLREANRVRQDEWRAGGDPEPDLSFRAVELAGEVGEACNVVKKLERERHGWRGSRATVDQLAEELADVVICADLLAMTAGIDLEAAVVAKFNATSEKVGLATRLGRPLTIEEDADLLEAEWTGSEAAVNRVTSRILASRSTPSVPAVADLSKDGLTRGAASGAERVTDAMVDAAWAVLASYSDSGPGATREALEAAEAERLREAVRRAALEWCGEKERETFPEDIEYFEASWRHLPGLRARVEAILARPSPVPAVCKPEGEE